MPRLTVLAGPGWERSSSQVGIVDVPHPHAPTRSKFSRPGPFAVQALRWTADQTSQTATSGEGLTFHLDEHVGWLAGEPGSADPSAVVKQVSFLHASATVTPQEFRHHYRHHVEVARRHMPTLWQYVQYDVTAIEASDDEVVTGEVQGIAAVSVLWFRSTDDFINRYFPSPEDEAQFRAQEGFLDLTKAFTFVATSHPSAAPTARP